MKTPLIIVLAFLAIHSFAQTSKFQFGIEYAPSFTSVTNQYHSLDPYNTGFWPVHNVFLRAGYALSSKFELTSGLGFLTSREFDYIEFDIQSDIENIKSQSYHHYLIIPFGFSYRFGSFFLNPEIGVGKNVGNKLKSEFTFADGSVHSGKSNDNNNLVNYYTFPVSFSLGNKIDLKSCLVQIGFRAYYDLNSLRPEPFFTGQHYYGFGMFGGVRF
jgi:hypothetical protein